MKNAIVIMVLSTVLLVTACGNNNDIKSDNAVNNIESLDISNKDTEAKDNIENDLGNSNQDNQETKENNNQEEDEDENIENNIAENSNTGRSLGMNDLIDSFETIKENKKEDEKYIEDQAFMLYSMFMETTVDKHDNQIDVRIPRKYLPDITEDDTDSNIDYDETIIEDDIVICRFNTPEKYNNSLIRLTNIIDTLLLSESPSWVNIDSIEYNNDFTHFTVKVISRFGELYKISDNNTYIVPLYYGELSEISVDAEEASLIPLYYSMSTEILNIRYTPLCFEASFLYNIYTDNNIDNIIIDYINSETEELILSSDLNTFIENYNKKGDS